MSKLDQFESAFKSASKAMYSHGPVSLSTVMVLSDLQDASAQRFTSEVKQFLRTLGDGIEWDELHCKAHDDVGDLLEEIERDRPHLVCCYRNLHGRARTFPFSLGAHVDVLTQATETPVLLLPAPDDDGALELGERGAGDVMVLTDHLTGCDRLIDHAVHFTKPGGSLVLAHLEDDAVYERYIEVIGKIPAIDTDVARRRIREQLLKEPTDYIDSVRSALGEADREITVVREVTMGHRVADCRRLIDKHSIGLVMMNTKDEDQLAMHGLAYPLAIELRDIPLLLL